MKCSDAEAIAAYRRVLKLTRSYIWRQRQDLLVTDGRGIMTWGEIRRHITEAIRLTHPAISKKRKRAE